MRPFKCERQLGGRCCLERVVGFRFQDVAFGKMAERNGRRRHALLVLDELLVRTALRVSRHE